MIILAISQRLLKTLTRKTVVFKKELIESSKNPVTPRLKLRQWRYLSAKHGLRPMDNSQDQCECSEWGRMDATRHLSFQQQR